MADLLRATPIKQTDGRFRFRVTVGGQDPGETFDASAEELASYERFRVVVLERTGKVATHAPCESLGLPAADRASGWWRHVAMVLRSGG